MRRLYFSIFQTQTLMFLFLCNLCDPIVHTKQDEIQKWCDIVAYTKNVRFTNRKRKISMQILNKKLRII